MLKSFPLKSRSCCGMGMDDTDVQVFQVEETRPHDDESTYESSDVLNHSGDPSENKNDYPAQNERVGGAKAMVKDDLSIFNHAGSRQRQRALPSRCPAGDSTSDNIKAFDPDSGKTIYGDTTSLVQAARIFLGEVQRLRDYGREWKIYLDIDSSREEWDRYRGSKT
jgi:hypothetical protein